MAEEKTSILADLVSSIVAAYVSKNSVPIANLPSLIGSVHASLDSLTRPPVPPAEPEHHTPAVPIRKSVSHDAIVCLEDGKRFKSLKRHLQAEHGMSADQYRAKWGLPKDYPMVAPAYATIRSEMAKTRGLGRKANGASLDVAMSPDADVPEDGDEA